jgi:hypothetical protein
MLANLQTLPAADLRLCRCQVDVAFPPGFKVGSLPHCPWFRDFAGMPQIIEVTDTGWETYHFQNVADAENFAEATRRHVENGTFAGGRLPLGSSVTIQLRATIEIARDFVAAPPSESCQGEP